MSFIISQIQTLENGLTQIRPIRTLALGGKKGLFARHLPELVKNDDVQWALTNRELVRLADPEAGEDTFILFNIPSGPDERKTFYRLEGVTGRTMSILTDALFQFRLLTVEPQVEGATDVFTTKNWNNAPERYEQMRLEGGSVGGTWSWAEAPQAVEAMVLRKS